MRESDALLEAGGVISEKVVAPLDDEARHMEMFLWECGTALGPSPQR